MIGSGERIERMGMAEREMKRYNRENQTNERGDNDEVYKSEMFFKKKTTRDEKFMLILR